MTRVLHVITGLGRGGAETMLQKLLSRTDRDRFTPEVVSLTTSDEIGLAIAATGVPVTALDMRRGVPNPSGLLRLARAMRRARPDVVQTWLYHADLLAGIVSRALRVPAIWNLRSGTIDPNLPRGTILTIRACAMLSHRVPARIVACSEASRRAHVEMGYDAGRMTTIANGFDLDVFRPDPQARAEVRAELGVPADAPVLGLVGRYDPVKNHRMFLEAAALILRSVPDAHFILCGSGITRENPAIWNPVAELGLTSRVHLLGERRDVARIDAALDVASSTSYSEGFPNVLGEAMACEVPCVVTDAGESAGVVGDTGRVVALADTARFAKAAVELLRSSDLREELGRRARARVAERFSLEASVRRYEALYDSVVASSR